MKIIIGYPSTESEKGIATLGQNRQFQWFSNPSYFYPIVPATAATMLKQDDNEVIWMDCIAEEISMENFLKKISKEKPNLFAFETKTPVIKQHWKTIDNLKQKFPEMKIVIYGDHVTSFPEETIKNSKVDFVICGGNYDFILRDLVRHLKNPKKQKIPKGVYFSKNKKISNSGKFDSHSSLDEAPFIDRELTKWKLYQKEYNIIKRPFFYIMSGRDCWWGKCTFCSWPRMYPCFKNRSVKNVLDEIGELIEKYNTKEIFDDSGTLSTGKWLKDLCKGLIERGYSKKITYSCNMRFGALSQEDFNLMKKAGFRLLKFGLESANQNTLDRLKKGIKIKDIFRSCRMAKKAGLTVHLTMIVGYPWETKKDAMNTYKLAKHLMQKNYADILQATVLMPYPGTPLWKEAKETDSFYINPIEYERYDQREPILKTKDSSPEEIAAICGKIYTIFLTPGYIWTRLRNIKSWEDIKWYSKGIGAVLGHLKDFTSKNEKK